MTKNWTPVTEKMRKETVTPFITVANGTMRIPMNAIRLLPGEPTDYRSLQILICEQKDGEIIGLRFLKEEAAEPETVELKKTFLDSGALKQFYFCDRLRLRFLFGEEETMSLKATRYAVKKDEEDPSILVIGERLTREEEA